MNEKLLHFIWQHGHYDTRELETTDGMPLEISDRGVSHSDQGPDFRNVSIRIGDTLWIGHVELHVRSSDWSRHRHGSDPNYRNVVLHVVWEHDVTGYVALPVLELRNRVPLHSLRRLAHWMNGLSQIPCEMEMRKHRIRPSEDFFDRLVRERLQRKSERILSNLASVGGHWEEVFWWQVARNFGYRVNADAFEEMARSVKVRLLQQNKHSIHLIEAILFGQCNFLDRRIEDAYGRMLASEYAFARRKYGLQPIRVQMLFLRMRPQNFPTVRLAQLAMLVRMSNRLFARLRHASTTEEARNLLSVTANDYWHYRFDFDKPSPFLPKTLGRIMADNVIANTVAPFLYAYAAQTGETRLSERAYQWLQETQAETNRTMAVFQHSERVSKSAFESQALLELRTNYCERRRCLECDVCAALLRGKMES